MWPPVRKSGAERALVPVSTVFAAKARLSGRCRAGETRAKLPVVFTPDEARAVLAQLSGSYRTIGHLFYGSGLRLMECLRLRVNDLDFGYSQSAVRDRKGGKDRVTMLPKSLHEALQRHLAKVKALHEDELAEGFGTPHLPHAWSGNIQTPVGKGGGSNCFPRRNARSIRMPS